MVVIFMMPANMKKDLDVLAFYGFTDESFRRNPKRLNRLSAGVTKIITMWPKDSQFPDILATFISDSSTKHFHL